MPIEPVENVTYAVPGKAPAVRSDVHSQGNSESPAQATGGLATLNAELTQSAHDARLGFPGAGFASRVPVDNAQLQKLVSHRWARWFVPSLTDLFFIALIVWMFMSGGVHGWQSLLADGDVGWHIRVGEYMLDHHAVPHHDLYSFSKPGAPWFAWEWLSDVIDAQLYRWAGLKGIVLFSASVLALFGASLIRRMTLAGAHTFALLGVGLLGVGAASIHFLARPHIFTLLLLSLTMGMIESDRRRPTAHIWWLVPVTLVWTNLHGGFLVLVLALGLAAVGAGIEAWLACPQPVHPRKMNWQPALRYVALAAATGAVTFINPYGWGLHAHILEYLRSDWIKNTIQEFQSPQFRGESMMQFEVLLFVGLASAGALLRRRRIVEALWVVAFSYLALSSARHIPLFVAALSPVLAVELTHWWNALTVGAPKQSIRGILDSMGRDLIPGFARNSLLPVAFLAILALAGKNIIPWPEDFPSDMFPTAMVHAHEQQILASRLITTDQWADYLIFLHPEQKVFADGRSDFYGPEIGNQFLHLINGARDWEKLLNKWNFDLALLPSDCALSQLLARESGWHVVANDGQRVLLARHEHVESRIALKNELERARP